VKRNKDHQLEDMPPDHVEAAFRYRMVAPLLDPSLSSDEKKAYRRSILRHKQEHPTRGLIRITGRTLRRWTRQYRRASPNEKVAALCPLPRSGGRAPLIPEKALALAQELLEANSRRSTEFLIKEIEHRHPELKYRVKASTLNRHLRLRHVNRRVLDDDGRPPQASFKPFEAKKPNDLWQSDVHHGPRAIVDGHLVSTRIIAWIDDYSRICCHCQAYPDETLPMLEDCLKKAIQKFGAPRCVYTDNGSIYSGVQFSLICADLEIIAFTSKPYSPWTHGKVERLWGVQEDQLWSEVALVDPLPLDELNETLRHWIAVRHHGHVHSQTGEKPLERWRQGVKAHGLALRQPAEEKLKRIFWLWERRTVSSTSIVKVFKNQYAVDPKLAGFRVLVRYDPYDLKSIQLWSNERRPEFLGTFTSEAPLVSPQAPRPTAAPRSDRKPCKAAQRMLDELRRDFERLQQHQHNLIQFPIDSNNKEVY
jgi:transposase InsO family protein